MLSPSFYSLATWAKLYFPASLLQGISQNSSLTLPALKQRSQIEKFPEVVLIEKGGITDKHVSNLINFDICNTLPANTRRVGTQSEISIKSESGYPDPDTASEYSFSSCDSPGESPVATPELKARQGGVLSPLNLNQTSLDKPVLCSVEATSSEDAKARYLNKTHVKKVSFNLLANREYPNLNYLHYILSSLSNPDYNVNLEELKKFLSLDLDESDMPYNLKNFIGLSEDYYLDKYVVRDFRIRLSKSDKFLYSYIHKLNTCDKTWWEAFCKKKEYLTETMFLENSSAISEFLFFNKEIVIDKDAYFTALEKLLELFKQIPSE